MMVRRKRGEEVSDQAMRGVDITYSTRQTSDIRRGCGYTPQVS